MEGLVAVEKVETKELIPSEIVSWIRSCVSEPWRKRLGRGELDHFERNIHLKTWRLLGLTPVNILPIF